MGIGFIVTGTGTDVGKTVITGGLLNWLTGEGYYCAPMKPVQTGCRELPAGESQPIAHTTYTGTKHNRQQKCALPVVESLSTPDLDFCLAAAGLTPGPKDLQLMAPYRYRPACSPHLAGRLTGTYAKISLILRAYRQLAKRYDVVLIEGAGGVMVPLNEYETFLDLIKLLKLPVIVVGLAGLGTINHTLLTLRALRAAQVQIFGCILNHTRPPEASAAGIYQDNLRTIACLGQTTILGSIGYIPMLNPTRPATWEQFATELTNKSLMLERIKQSVSR